MEIKKLTLFSNNIDEQEQFYGSTLGFPIERTNKKILKVKTNENLLVFESSVNKFCYHFAFLINTGSLESAMDFLKKRDIALLPYQGSEVIHFNSGRSIYFFDKDGNIAEFIERPSLPYKKTKDFSIKNVIKINEIGLPIKDTIKMAIYLSKDLGITPINKDEFTDSFCWVGDFNGVIIVVKEGRNWLPTNIPGTANDFKISYSEKGIEKNIGFKNNLVQVF